MEGVQGVGSPRDSLLDVSFSRPVARMPRVQAPVPNTPAKPTQHAGHQTRSPVAPRFHAGVQSSAGQPSSAQVVSSMDAFELSQQLQDSIGAYVDQGVGAASILAAFPPEMHDIILAFIQSLKPQSEIDDTQDDDVDDADEVRGDKDGDQSEQATETSKVKFYYGDLAGGQPGAG